MKIYDVTDWTTNTSNIHIAHISRSNGNQAMKFGQLIEHNAKCGGETIPRPFSKTPKFLDLWINHLNFYTVCSYCSPKEGYEIY